MTHLSTLIDIKARVINKEGARIREMFNSLANNYDVANDVLSFGMHRLWKKQLVQKLPKGKVSVLDCATGTGDIAILIKQLNPKADVTAIDFSEKMLDQAPAKAEKAGIKNIRFLVADILKLPFGPDSFDQITISFGIRNVENLLNAIEEFEKILKPKGILHILEFGQPANPSWSKIYSAYHRGVLPVIGGLITGNMKAYSYLNKSSEEFPTGESFMKQFPPTSWKALETKPLLGGIAYIYRIQKL